jgi:hypothetical protein
MLTHAQTTAQAAESTTEITMVLPVTVTFFGELPKDCTPAGCATMLLWAINRDEDGRRTIAIEAFEQLIRNLPLEAAQLTIIRAIGSRPGGQRLIQTGPGSQTAASVLIAEQRIKALRAYIRTGPVQITGDPQGEGDWTI